MYELFVLGELMDRSLHGYMIQTVLQYAVGPVRQISWGALYPLLRRLQRDGYVAMDVDKVQGGGGPPRKLYHITPAGRDRFFALMLEQPAYDADYRDLFCIKMVNFDWITREQRLAILRHYHAFLQSLHESMDDREQHVRIEPHIPETERMPIQRVIAFRRHAALAECEWIDAEIARVGEEPSAATAKTADDTIAPEPAPTPGGDAQPGLSGAPHNVLTTTILRERDLS